MNLLRVRTWLSVDWMPAGIRLVVLRTDADPRARFWQVWRLLVRWRLYDPATEEAWEMRSKPERCTPIGTYECSVPMPLGGRVQGIDYCIADIVAALNAGGLTTMASCCGHGLLRGVISLEDGRELLVRGLGSGEVADRETEMVEQLRAALEAAVEWMEWAADSLDAHPYATLAVCSNVLDRLRGGSGE